MQNVFIVALLCERSLKDQTSWYKMKQSFLLVKNIVTLCDHDGAKGGANVNVFQ